MKADRGTVTSALRVTLLLAALVACNQAAEADRNQSPAPARRRLLLRDGWLVKQIGTGKPDIAALTRESVLPDNTWRTAQMPAQAHDVLLAHGLIPDHVLELAWVIDAYRDPAGLRLGHGAAHPVARRHPHHHFPAYPDAGLSDRRCALRFRPRACHHHRCERPHRNVVLPPP